jgi:signal recognition particle subunit SRP54
MFDFLSSRFSSVFSRISGQSSLTEQNIDETLHKVREALFEADVPYQVVVDFIADIKREVVGQKITSSLRPGEQLVKIMHDRLKNLLGADKDRKDIQFPAKGVVLMIGLQGSGKTTTVAKCIKRLIMQDKTKKILCASVDLYRPAAIDQLQILSQNVGASFYRAPSSTVIEATKEINAFFKQGSYDLLFLDTAGRLHVDQQMLNELKEIVSISRPTCSILVVDGMIGQESLTVAQQFNTAVGFDWAILSKLDSDAKAGVALAFSYMLKKPIAFIGTGEKVDDLEQFHPERAAGKILGMGDIQSLLERAEQKIKKQEQDDMARSLMSGTITLSDFARQLDMMGRLGSLSSLMQYMPGMPSVSLGKEQLAKGEEQMKRFRAIINSMTPKERLNERILNGSRKMRIAKGAGATVQEVNLLLQKFEESKQFVKLLKRMGKFPGF